MSARTVAFLMWHCAVGERNKDNDAKAMQYSSISKALSITGIVITFVIGTVIVHFIVIVHVQLSLRQFFQCQLPLNNVFTARLYSGYQTIDQSEKLFVHKRSNRA